MKHCHKCGRDLDESKFYKDKSRKDGLQNKCKDCERAYREANSDRIKAREREYYLNNQDAIKARVNEYRLDNPELIKERKKQYYLNNREDIIAKAVIWSQTEAGKISKCRTAQRRRGYGHYPLNSYFTGAHFHHLHIHDDDEGIFIPEYLHTYVYHNSSTWQGMDIMNVIALLYLMSEKLNGDKQWEL
jgi:hypothetical protein